MGKCKEIQFNETSRKTIHECLYQKYKAYKIASIVAHHSSSVSREIFLHRKRIESKINASKKCSTCLLFKTCKLKKVCGSFMCKGDCRYCKSSEACNSYKPIECKIQFRFPFVCYKDCPHYSYCGLDKYEYDPIVANNEAMITRKASRMGLDMTEEQFKKMDDALFSKVNDGQSINHICKNNKDVIRGKSSIYSYVSKQFLKIKAIDLPKAVTYKVRTKIPSQYEYKENKNFDRSGHLYYDWLVYKAKNRVVLYWEMDFLGCPHESKQEILTLACPQLEFLLMFVVDRPNKKEDVLQIFDNLEKTLGSDLFSKIFEVIVTDRDSRFNFFKELEFNSDGIRRTHLFYCNPSESNEKPLVENENSQIRIIFPKGKIIEGLSQETLLFITSNFNCRSIESLDNHCALELFKDTFGDKAIESLGLKIINPNDITIKKYNKY